ncbi:MAG: ATP-binding protein [Acidobacteria bacterium]|nr:ATP-binding protein [Acidobacteriota bacterium]MCI0723801.1 ATP-binding protein [Acidobacteriota bacterium]
MKDQDDLVKRLAQKSAEVRVLRRIAVDINSTLDLDPIYDIVLRTMDEFFGFHHSIILLLEDADTLRVVATHGYGDQALGGTVAVGVGVIGMVAKRRRLMRVNHLRAQHAYFARIRSQMEEAGRATELGEIVAVPGLPDADSQIAIPLVIKDKLIGVFSVESREQRPFSEYDETLVTIVASQAASAIQNALLYRAGEERRRELAEAHERLGQLNETLEDRVRTRTRELERANRDLRETQAQLVQSSKMASLGTLAAGIAHELNTPIGAIHSNADVERRAAGIIRGILQEPSVAKKLGQQPRLDRTLRIFDDINQMTLEATERLTRIVQSLKSFARLDQPDLELVDLHEGLESTLTLLDHLIKDRIQVVRNYGELPKVHCYASQINQVFANVLTNAVQAIEEPGSITITTRQDESCVLIRVADTGVGIRPEHIERIFDPGYTTKGVGVGTGLGLSITYRIIENHHGSIHVQSELGKGTTFTIRLPITQSR